MSIFINNKSRVIIQGLGKEGLFHAQQCRDYGTKIVGAVKPGKGGTSQDGIPLFNTVREAKANTKANVSLIFVPAAFAADAILEAIDADMPLIITITEHIPVRDMVHVRNRLNHSASRMIGPNCPGVISPGQCKVGIMPGYIHKKGRVGVVSRSGTLTYEAVAQLTALGIGQSTCIGIGGDPVVGTTHIDALAAFNEDPGTDAVVMIGEIGGTAEEEAAAWVKKHMTKPVVAFIAGQTAPPGRRMGHAGAIISGGKGTAAEKMAALRKAGITVCESPADIGVHIEKVLEKVKAKPKRKTAKKKTAKKKTAKKKTTKKKATKKKSVRKKTTKKKTARKKTTRKKAGKKKSAARRTGRKKAVKKTTKRKTAGRKQTGRKKATKKRSTRRRR